MPVTYFVYIYIHTKNTNVEIENKFHRVTNNFEIISKEKLLLLYFIGNIVFDPVKTAHRYTRVTLSTNLQQYIFVTLRKKQ